MKTYALVGLTIFLLLFRKDFMKFFATAKEYTLKPIKESERAFYSVSNEVFEDGYRNYNALIATNSDCKKRITKELVQEAVMLTEKHNLLVAKASETEKKRCFTKIKKAELDIKKDLEACLLESKSFTKEFDTKFKSFFIVKT